MRKFFIFLFLFTLIFNFVLPASADGGLYYYDPFASRWDYVKETSQQAFINYEDGLQRMIIGTTFEKQNDNDVLWIFPVPAEPQRVVIDVVTKFPLLQGEELSQGVKSEVQNAGKLVYATQLYTLPFLSRRVYTATSYYGGATGLGANASFGVYKGAPDVVVYEEVNKEGMTTEIVTAQTTDGLYNYIRSKGLKIDNGAMPAYDPYIGKNYTFVISWIKSQPQTKTTKKDLEDRFEYVLDRPSQFPQWQAVFREFESKYIEMLRTSGYDWAGLSGTGVKKDFFRKNYLLKDLLLQMIQSNGAAVQEFDNFFFKNSTKKQRGILVTFPTKKLYFPLIPTSIYGSTVVPATIRVVGHVSPKVFADIKPYIHTTYYRDSYVDRGAGLLDSFWGPEIVTGLKGVKYTKVEINAPSKMLTNDLWFAKKAPLKTYWQSFIVAYPEISVVLLIILNSSIVGLLLGLLLFREARQGRGWLKFLLIGSANLLTVIGFILAVFLLPTKKIKEDDKMLFAELKQRGYRSWGWRIIDYRKLIFVPAFSVFYLIFSWLVFLLLSI